MFRGVVPFEPFGEAARFWRGKGRVERGGRVRAQIVLDQPDLFSAGKMHVRQFLEHLCVIGGGVAVGDLDAAPACRSPGAPVHLIIHRLGAILARPTEYRSNARRNTFSAGFAQHGPQSLYFTLADEIPHFLKGAIWPHVGLDNIIVDAQSASVTVRADTKRMPLPNA